MKICKVCGKEREKGKPDPCLGRLPGVMFACCGHGKRGYIYFENGTVIRFRNAQVDTVKAETKEEWERLFGPKEEWD